MDPIETLRLAYAALAKATPDIESAQEHLDNYREWRAAGGFEPFLQSLNCGGDAFEQYLLRHAEGRR